MCGAARSGQSDGETMEHSSRKRGKCPICGTATVEAYRPFCSGRCADVDLGRWFSGTYRIPTDERPDEADWPAAEEEES